MSREPVLFDESFVRQRDLVAGPWRSCQLHHVTLLQRGLLSCAVDRLDKKRFRMLTSLPSEDPSELAIKIILNHEEHSLTIKDNGIGLTAQDVDRDAACGFLPRRRAILDEAECDELLAHAEGLGVVFLLGPLCSIKLVLQTREAGGQCTFETKHERAFTLCSQRGQCDLDFASGSTTVKLYLKPDCKSLLDVAQWRSQLSPRDCGSLGPLTRGYPVLLWDQSTNSWDTLRYKPPVWAREPDTVPDVEIMKFHEELTECPEEPLAFKHFKVVGQLEYSCLLFVPPTHHPQQNFVLKVRGQAVEVDGTLMLPSWLHCLSGVVDCEDFPANVDNDFVRGSKITKVVRKQIARKAVEMFEALAEDEASFARVYQQYGRRFKQAILDTGPSTQVSKAARQLALRLVGLLRFQTSTSVGELVGLADFVRDLGPDTSEIPFAMVGSDCAGATTNRARTSAQPASTQDRPVLLLREDVDKEVLLWMDDGWDGLRFVEVGWSEPSVTVTATSA